MDYISNEPNAAKLISSLRNTGYDSYAAIEDIIDNSVDAHAKIVKVNVESNRDDFRVVIADNGIGMDSEFLDQALKLGSLTDKDEISDLGKFGMGLCTASISMARKLEVITREEGGACLYAAQDLDDVVEKNRFVKIQRDASPAEEKLLESMIGRHGTVVMLSKVDRLSDKNIAQFTGKLSRDIGRIYRKFIQAGVEMFVNGKKIPPIDPLMLEHQNTRVYSDETYDLPASAADGRKEKVGVKIVILPEVNEQLEKDLRMNIHSQGFYVLRNNREIADGVTLGIFGKHNDFNRLRVELSFGASLDNEMGVRFSKDGVAPSQAITDFLKQEVGGQIASIRQIIKRGQKADPNSVVDHSDSEEVIAKKAKLLIVPDAKIEKRGPRKNRGSDVTPTDETKTPRSPRSKFDRTQPSSNALNVRFETAAMNREGSIYECEQQGKTIIIRWNSDHPFYDQVVFPNRSTRGIVSALDYLVFGLASAELKVTSEETVELLSTLKSILSSNLRALLS